MKTHSLYLQYHNVKTLSFLCTILSSLRLHNWIWKLSLSFLVLLFLLQIMEHCNNIISAYRDFVTYEETVSCGVPFVARDSGLLGCTMSLYVQGMREYNRFPAVQSEMQDEKSHLMLFSLLLKPVAVNVHLPSG